VLKEKVEKSTANREMFRRDSSADVLRSRLSRKATGGHPRIHKRRARGRMAALSRWRERDVWQR